MLTKVVGVKGAGSGTGNAKKKGAGVEGAGSGAGTGIAKIRAREEGAIRNMKIDGRC